AAAVAFHTAVLEDRLDVADEIDRPVRRRRQLRRRWRRLRDAEQQHARRSEQAVEDSGPTRARWSTAPVWPKGEKRRQHDRPQSLRVVSERLSFLSGVLTVKSC